MTKFEVVNNLVKVISPSTNSVSSQYCMLLGCVYRQTPLSYEYLKVNQLGICLAFASGLVSGFSGTGPPKGLWCLYTQPGNKPAMGR